MTTYTLRNEDQNTVLRDDGWIIPIRALTADSLEYDRWLKDGNVPNPAPIVAVEILPVDPIAMLTVDERKAMINFLGLSGVLSADRVTELSTAQTDTTASSGVVVS